MKTFIAELRRRNVLRVATAYALVAWIIIEAGSVLLPTFGASQHVFQLYVIVVIIGFLVAIVFAWVFELTPEGVRLDRNVDRTTLVDAGSKQKMNYAIIALLAIALGVSITFNVTGVRKQELPVAHKANSIAVLPFTSRSSDPENLLFTDGIQDDLITKLANIGALRVISRTSVMKYRDTSRNLRKIAEELGVDTILEGAVQRVGDSVRINLQLIDARTDDHLWAQIYDRELTMQNIFSIQSEISEAVVAKLQMTLTTDEQTRMTVVPTRDLRAYRLFKEAKNNLYQRRLDSMRIARDQFREAIELDSRYAEAYAGLAESNLLLFINYRDLSEAEAMSVVQANIDRALELDPNLADAYAILGLMHSTRWSHTRTGTDNVAAEAAFRHAIALNPNHASAYMWFASLRDAEERLDDAIGLYQQSMELDPLGLIPHSNLPLVYAKQGLSHEALQLWLEAIRINNEWPTIYHYIALQLWGMGRLDESFAWHTQANEVSTDMSIGGNIGLGILFELGLTEQVRELLDHYPEADGFFPLVDAFTALLENRYVDAHKLFVAAINEGTVPAKLVYALAADSALIVGNLADARKFTLEANPVLGSDSDVTIDRTTVRDIVLLAYIDQRHGHDARAFRQLTSALEALEALPRLGTFGYGILDVEIYALLGRKDDALAAFREAIDAGFRGSIFFDTWTIALDPYLDNIRNDPRFVKMTDELDQYLDEMRNNLLQAERSQDFAALRARVETI